MRREPIRVDAAPVVLSFAFLEVLHIFQGSRQMYTFLHIGALARHQEIFSTCVEMGYNEKNLHQGFAEQTLQYQL